MARDPQATTTTTRLSSRYRSGMKPLNVNYYYFNQCPADTLLAPTRPTKKNGRNSVSEGQPPSPTRGGRDKPAVSLLQHSILGLQASTSGSSALKGPTTVQSKPSAPVALVEKIREPLAFVLQPPEEQTDNWDDDFEDGPSFTKLQGMHAVE